MRISAILYVLGLALPAGAACAKEQDPTCGLQITRFATDLLEKTTEQNIGEVLRRAQAGEKNAQLTLALLYPDGKFVPKDMSQAIAWAGRAAAQGGAAEKEYLRFLALTHQADAQPFEELIRRGAEADVLYFQYAQAELLRSTRPREAVRWYETAAAKGCMDARTKLSEIYQEQGKPDPVQAHMWISLADYANGFSGELKKYFEYDESRVRKAQARLRRKMTRPEIAEAERLAVRWAEQHGESYATRTWPDDAIVYLTDRSLSREIAAANGYLYVHFSSFDENCLPCIESNARIDDLARRYAGQIVFARIAWEPWMEINREAGRRYGVQALPTMLLFKDAREYRRWQGASTDRIAEELDRCCAGVNNR